MDATKTPQNLNTFFILLFITSIPFWILGELVSIEDMPINIPISALMAFNPMLIALFLTYRKNGKSATIALLRRAFDYQRITHKIWVWLMPIILLVAFGLQLLTGTVISALQFPIHLMPIFFIVFFITACGEEIGWQGYACDNLQTRRTALETGIILGMVWAVWHIIPYFQAGNSAWWVIWQCVATVGLRIIIIWLYNNTNYSIFATIVFHAMINVGNFLFPNYGSYYDPFMVSIVIWGVVVIIIYIWKPKTLTGKQV